MPQSRRTFVPAAQFIEASLALLPTDAGGTRIPIAPRDGNYVAYLTTSTHTGRPRVRIIEGPAVLRAGDIAIVMIEALEPGSAVESGDEFNLEDDESVVGVGTVLRTWSRS
jgi:hypothetical protein